MSKFEWYGESLKSMIYSYILRNDAEEERGGREGIQNKQK
jgi:hypothetical protein